MLSLSAAHVHLLVAILAEVVATSSLKASDGQCFQGAFALRC